MVFFEPIISVPLNADILITFTNVNQFVIIIKKRVLGALFFRTTFDFELRLSDFYH